MSKQTSTTTISALLFSVNTSGFRDYKNRHLFCFEDISGFPMISAHILWAKYPITVEQSLFFHC